MKYTEEQLKFIREKKPELIYKPEPTLDIAIVTFLEKYEVYVKPASTSKRAAGDVASGALAGAIGGLAGADVAGDAFIIRGQQKQTAIQEWTQWKQWALDHKDFPKFQTDLFNEITAYNKNIDNKFQDPEYIKNVLDPLIKDQNNRKKLVGGLVFSILAFAIGYGIIANIYIYQQENNQTTSVKSE